MIRRPSCNSKGRKLNEYSTEFTPGTDSVHRKIRRPSCYGRKETQGIIVYEQFMLDPESGHHCMTCRPSCHCTNNEHSASQTAKAKEKMQ
jgi:hypothetical protein